jgi:phosphohistidine phosphatase
MSFTTNEEDQRKAAELKARLADDSKDNHPAAVHSNDYVRVPNVSIDEGTHKYVLISARLPGGTERQNFVTSRRGAEYHQNAAEPFVEALERNNYTSIRITGGGRIALDNDKKTCSIYGYSYGFGLADHALSKAVVESDSRYLDFDITCSNEGY